MMLVSDMTLKAEEPNGQILRSLNAILLASHSSPAYITDQSPQSCETSTIAAPVAAESMTPPPEDKMPEP